MTIVLSLNNISKSFKKIDAVRDVSLDVAAGECLALVGHNGAGKTTIFKMILGLLTPSNGKISVLGSAPGNSAAIGFLPESVSFHARLTGLEHLEFFTSLRGSKDIDFDKALKKVGLDGEGGRAVGGYSKGMRQRLGLAQALIGSPKLLILDEPTSGLDPSSRRSFYNMLDDLRRQGTTIILSSHALTEVEAYTSDVAILNKGKLLAHGPLSKLTLKANLPVQLDVRMINGSYLPELDEFSSLKICDGVLHSHFKLEVSEGEKLALLHKLSGFGDIISDIRIHPPTLDDLYSQIQEAEK